MPSPRETIDCLVNSGDLQALVDFLDTLPGRECDGVDLGMIRRIAAERLLERARSYPDLGADRRRELLRTALRVRPGDADVLLAWAWQCFDDGQPEEAKNHARQAAAVATYEMSDCSAAIGWFLLAEKDYEQADAILSEAIGSFPEHAAINWYYGLLRFEQGKPEAAVAPLLTALRVDPQLDEAAATLAWALHDLGRDRDAIRWSRYALRRSRTKERLAQLGWFLLKTGHGGRAAIPLARALALDPAQTTVRRHLAESLARVRHFAAAQRVLREGLVLAPDDPELLRAEGWLLHELGEQRQAHAVAERLARTWPDDPAHWHLLGVVHSAEGNWHLAADCLTQAVALDPGLAQARWQLVRALHRLRRNVEACDFAAPLLPSASRDPALLCECAGILIACERVDDARALLLPAAKRHPVGEMWRLLALTFAARGRKTLALLALARASRLAPRAPLIWQQRAQVAMDVGNHAVASLAIAQATALAPEDLQSRRLAAAIFEQAGRLDLAQVHAEFVLAQMPGDAEAWRMLAQIRYRQRRRQEAEELLQTALSLAPGKATRWQAERQLGWLRLADRQFAQAEDCFRLALDDGDPHVVWAEIAEARRRAGKIQAALEAAAESLRQEDEYPAGRLVTAKILADDGIGKQDEAARLCVSLLLEERERAQACELLARLATNGSERARSAFRLIDRSNRHLEYLRLLDIAQGRLGNRHFRRLAAIAESDMPEDPALATARLHSLSFDDSIDVGDLSRATREWYRRMLVLFGVSQLPSSPQSVPTGRLRVAYLASHLHRSLLLEVLRAHDPAVVQVFLYTACSIEAAQIPSHVAVHDLREHDLEVSVKANRIDIVVDTVGLHPYVGQMEVVRALMRRIAPVQCGWLGSWGSSGGMLDVLLADAVSLPVTHDNLYQERIARIPGGQWAWSPPTRAPHPGPPPCIERGYVTFGTAVRGLRLTEVTLRCWARVLGASPGSRLMILGHQCDDFDFQSDFLAILDEEDVAASRVAYVPHRDYDRYLDLYRDIDVVLDAFPSNGGLCLLDALWMGVPVVTQAGRLLGERQGASIVAAVGHPEWACSSAEEYLSSILALTEDRPALQTLRAELRGHVLRSPLVSPERMARSLESIYTGLCAEIERRSEGANGRDQIRTLARRSLRAWLEKPISIDLTPRHLPASAPDVSVVIVLFNQAGLARLTLSALADQAGATFETIIVDNGSDVETKELLARIKGARIVRNSENRGFLLAANQGAELATGRNILFLNSDAVMLPDALSIGVRALDGDASIGAVGGRLVLADGTLQEAGSMVFSTGATRGYGRGRDPRAWEFAFQRDCDMVSGAFLMLRRDVWQALDGFDTRYAPAYYEDSDLCMRITAAGLRIVYHPDIWVSHLEWGSAEAIEHVHALMHRNQSLFRNRHAEALAAHASPLACLPCRDRWSVRSRKARVLFVDNCIPHMAGGGGQPRAVSLIAALAAYDLTFFPLEKEADDWREVYRTLPRTVEVANGAGPENFFAFLSERRGLYDVLIVSRPPNMRFVNRIWDKHPELFEGVGLIYDAEALFAIRDIEKARLLGKPMSEDRAKRLVADELVQTRRANIVFAVSEGDAAHFRSAGARDVRLVPACVEARDATPGWESRSGLLFVGALQPDTPNEDGLLWFVSEVMPLIEKQLGFMPLLQVVGECRSAKISALQSPWVRLVGRVDDVAPHYDRARVFVAPTRYAAGVPAKVIEAASNGIPVVATANLIPQLGWEDDCIRGASQADEFAGQVIALYRNPDMWHCQVSAARAKTIDMYSLRHFRQLVDESVKLLVLRDGQDIHSNEHHR